MSYFLENYKQLLARVDSLCSTITNLLGKQITCSVGCSSCCTSITIFPVEAAAIRDALDKLPHPEAEKILRHISEQVDGERCPILYKHQCMLYDSRPIICRTHGLPILYTSDGQQKSDCCRLNFSENVSVPGSAVVDLDKLNMLLVAVNSLYLSQSESPEADLRVTIAEALSGNRNRVE